jgi:hypothetical protein
VGVGGYPGVERRNNGHFSMGVTPALYHTLCKWCLMKEGLFTVNVFCVFELSTPLILGLTFKAQRKHISVQTKKKKTRAVSAKTGYV